MGEPVTVGMFLGTMAVIGGFVLIVGLVCYVLSIIAEGFKH